MEKKKLKDVLQDSIKLAENGIKVDKYLYNFFKGNIYKDLIKKIKIYLIFSGYQKI